MTDAGRNTAAALILFFALIMALLTALIVPTFINWTENGRSIRENREKIAAIRTSQTSFVRVKRASDNWSLFARSPEAGFLDAATPEDAVVEARAYLTTLIARHGGSLGKAEFTPGETKRSQVETVVMDVTATLPKNTLAPFLVELENSPPYALVSAFRATENGEDRVTLVLKSQMQRLSEAPL